LEPSVKARIYSLDLLRGLVMIIMALDHVRDFFHFDAWLHDPLDVTTTTIPLYFTRWITHFCAPVFVFLSGTSIYLQGLRKDKNDLSMFLVKRGLWLIFVELIIITFSWTLNFTYPVFVMQVIWAIGICMVFMGFVIQLPYAAIMFLGVAIVAGHNILDYVPSTHNGFFWDLTRNGNFSVYEPVMGHKFVIIYPFVPWLGVMMLGYCVGKVYDPSFDPAERKKLLIRFGAGLLILFALIRSFNGYGNPFQWSNQESVVYTFLSFMNVHKYPPSLLYICATLGPALLFLAFFERANNTITRVISVFGRVPLFYYVLHFYFIRFLCMFFFVARGHSINEQTPDLFGMPFKFVVAGEGVSLVGVYIIWILLVAALYPLCAWFNKYKINRNNWWLSYL
jgi:uncharacterized membrane protein